MNGELEIPIPAQVASHFVVVTNDTISDPTARLHQGLAALDTRAGAGGGAEGALRHCAVGFLQEERLVVHGHHPPATSWQHGLHLAASADQLAFITRAGYHLVISSLAEPHLQPLAAQSARLAARLLARATHGVIIDQTTQRALPDSAPATQEPATFTLGDNWLAVAIHIPVHSTVHSGLDGSSQTRALTRGLARFGLPEVETAGFPEDAASCAVDLLHALAWRLLTRHWSHLTDDPGATTCLLGTDQQVSTADLQRFWGATPTRPAGQVHLRLTKAGGDHAAPPQVPYGRSGLHVMPPPDYHGALATWWRTTVAPAMPAPDSTPDTPGRSPGSPRHRAGTAGKRAGRPNHGS
ncbi:hypothetical protein [Actinomadura sp. SCN-SB]|uniref:hypothetical protein n=1 Tax=Actinomadura sp. SCN-SB TaxID=3373092 RepID=UPI0037521ED7